MPVPRKTKPKQRRRSAEQARHEILASAEEQLRARGPDAIRLQEVARAAGVSHPTVLYHFGSRDELVNAVVKRAIERLRSELVGAFTLTDVGVPEAVAMLERALQILADRGVARQMAWLLLSEAPSRSSVGPEVEELAQAAHAQRVRRHGAKAAEYEETLFVVLLGALLTFADGVAGDALRASAGLAGDKHAARRFRTWFAKLLVERMERPADAPPGRRKRVRAEARSKAKVAAKAERV